MMYYHSGVLLMMKLHLADQTDQKWRESSTRGNRPTQSKTPYSLSPWSIGTYFCSCHSLDFPCEDFHWRLGAHSQSAWVGQLRQTLHPRIPLGLITDRLATWPLPHTEKSFVPVPSLAQQVLQLKKRITYVIGVFLLQKEWVGYIIEVNRWFTRYPKDSGSFLLELFLSGSGPRNRLGRGIFILF